MLSTLLEIGEQISENRSKWDDIIEAPKIDENRTNYVLNIIFNINEDKIETSPENIEKYNKDSPLKHKLLKTLKGNAKKVYVATLSKKMEHLKESLLGKEERDKPQLINDIDSNFGFLKKSDFYSALLEITGLDNHREELETDNVKKQLKLSQSSNLVFCYSSIKSDSFNDGKATELSELQGFEDYIEKKFFNNIKGKVSDEEKLDYSKGEYVKDVVGAKFQRGYNLNAMFVTTTKNFLSEFEDKNASKNYQLSNQSIKYLDRAASYLINNLTFRIAGINHVIVPEFFKTEEIDIEMALDNIRSKNELLFNLKNFDALDTALSDEADDSPYWLNYIGIDSDGNFFKASNYIKDVSKHYLIEVIRRIKHINIEFEEYLGDKIFNFYRLYNHIPVRDGVKKNIALNIYSDIFKKIEIDRNTIFSLFNQYLKCQRSGQFDAKNRHNSYPNIRGQQSFDFAIANAVSIYSAFIKLLNELNLLKTDSIMENTIQEPNEGKDKTMNDQIESFFRKMNYNESQKALFYLGRILNSIGYAQYQKGHTSKPIMNKINYNGMDRDDIRRLIIDLKEKAKQYDILGKTEYNFSRFTDYFNYNEWNMDPEEAVFFLLSGYSFFITKEKE